MVRWPFKLLLTAWIVLRGTAFGAIDWKPVDPQDLTQRTPTVEKDADAEALFWNIWIDDSNVGTIFTHYVRVKIFTARGVESLSRIDLPYFGRSKITDIVARTIKSDGTIVELKKDTVFDRTLIKAGKAKLQAKSFVLPNVEPGAIVEYQYREQLPRYGEYLRLEFQREIPARSVKYYFRPRLILPAIVQPFNMQNIPLVKETDGYSSLSLSNVSAFREESYMPPEAQVRPWVLIHYALSQSADAYWSNLGKSVFEVSKIQLKIDNDIKRATTGAIGAATAAEEKLRRLFDFCRSKITNPYDDASGYTVEELAKLKGNIFPSDTLKRGIGTDFDIDSLFAAMAIAAGFDARIVLVGDRSDIFFDPALADRGFLTRWDVAIKVGTEWRFFNPGNRYVTFGMLDWREEGQPALLPDPTSPTWIKTPLSAADRSALTRTATLKLTDDGTLEGDVEIVYTGHFAVDQKEFHDHLTATEQSENIINNVKERTSTAEVTDVKLENVKDPDRPLSIRYHVRIPQYAQRTGTRLFFQPGFFQHGQPALFPAATRTYPVYFHYPWSERDDVSIQLPADVEIENGEAPGATRAADLATHEIAIQLVTEGKTKTVKYQRRMAFGLNGTTLFPLQAYDVLKTIFAAFHQRDEHMLTLKASSTR